MNYQCEVIDQIHDDLDTRAESFEDVVNSVFNVEGIDLDSLSIVIANLELFLYKRGKQIEDVKLLSDDAKLADKVVNAFLRIALSKLADEIDLRY